MALRDLYLTSTGVWVHVRIGQYMADVLRAAGATEAGYNWAMPYSRKVADVAAVFETYQGKVIEVYELKPASWARFGKFDEAAEQLDEYIALLTRGGDYARVKRGGHFAAEPGSVVLPHEYTPELQARCLEVLLRTYENLGRGLVFYTYRHLKGTVNGRDCSKRTRQEVSADLIGYVYDVAGTTLPRNMHTDTAQLRLVQVAQTDGPDAMLSAFVGVYQWWQHPDTDAPSEEQGLSDRLFVDLMLRPIPGIFKENPRRLDGLYRRQGWSCTEKKCG